MRLVLYPRVAPSNSLRVWVGAFQSSQTPVLSWRLDNVAVDPKALRQISSVRSAAMLAGIPAAKQERAFTGVYEFTGLQPDTIYRVDVTSESQTATLETRTLPDSVATQLDRSFNVLLVSCFHQSEDRSGLAGTIVSQLSSTSKPHLTILAGDQVYLDLPTLKDFPDNLPLLAQKFEQDYTLNWAGPLSYTEVLKAAPGISTPDDHEYWNNYPHPSPFIGNSRTPAGQARWRDAAQAMYEGFQLSYPTRLGFAETIDVHPLSFFFADTRTGKDINRSFTMTKPARKQLDDWVTSVIAAGRFGVFVSGQSLFAKAAGNIGGAVGDYELANYGDYGEIMQSLRRLVDEGKKPVLCLTGDVHWGRVATTRDIRTGRTAFAEVISSPASLVSTVGADQVKLVVNVFGGLFGDRNPWPRHSEPADVPAFLAADVLGSTFPCSRVHGQRGNHVVILSFRQQGGGLELRVKYWPISHDIQVGKPIEVGPIELVNS